MNISFSYFIKQKQAKLKELMRYSSYYFEYLSWFLLSFSKFKRKPQTIKKILVVNYGALGDVFSTLRVVKNLVINNPGIEFYYLGYDFYSKQVISLGKEIGAKIILEDDLKNINFDMMLLFSFPGRLRKLFNKSVFCVGNEYSSIRESIESSRNWFINRKVFPKPWDRHKIRQEIRIIKKAGLNISEPLIDTKIRENKKVELELKKSKIKKFAIIHPSGKNFNVLMKEGKTPSLAWPLERFSEIADYLIEKYKLEIIITGSKDESFIGEEVKKKTKNKKKIHNLSGKFNVEELDYLVSKAQIVVSIDTSIVHIAEFVGAKVIVLFGPTFVEEVGAYGNKEKQVNICHPEYCVQSRGKGKAPDKENICMKSISVEEVKDAIDKIMTYV